MIVVQAERRQPFSTDYESVDAPSKTYPLVYLTSSAADRRGYRLLLFYYLLHGHHVGPISDYSLPHHDQPQPMARADRPGLLEGVQPGPLAPFLQASIRTLDLISTKAAERGGREGEREEKRAGVGKQKSNTIGLRKRKPRMNATCNHRTSSWSAGVIFHRLAETHMYILRE